MASARHPKATFFVQRQLFSGVTSFAELEQKIAALPDEQSRGAAFEVFAEAYLATQRKHDAAQVWPHGSVPLDLLKNLGLTQQDQGVDGVLQTLLGQFNAYQVKFRTGRPSLTWRELSTFIGLADSPHIHSRVLLTNCDELPAVLNDRQGFFCIRGSDLDRLEAGDFRAMEAWLADAAFVAPKKSPQPHQIEALEALLPALQTHDRVSAIMACGTGKTLVALWVAEKVAQAVGSREATPRKLASHEVAGNGPTNFTCPEGTPDFRRPVRTDSCLHGEPDTACLANFQCPCGTNAAKILILLPSLALLRQTLHEWLRETRLPSLAYLCVCSDPTVKEGLDALATPQSDLDFQVSTDAASVRRFLDAPFAGVKMIFSTYQSASVVGAAMQPGEAFDFAVFDEAHKTAGREGRNFGFALEDKNLPIRKRLFLTATPRHYNPRDRDRDGEARLLFSMDNPAVYGPQAYRLTFAEAARRGIICGYKVIISVITSEMVTNELLSHGEVLVNGDAVRARQVANQIALRGAIEKYGVKKVFTFHRDVKSAQSFVSAGPEGVGTHLNGDGRAVLPRRPDQNELAAPQRGPTDDFQTFHVNGSMPTARRERELRDFRAAARAVVSNARCLTEGVDVPAVDMVAFLSPRRSRVDIVQATGRAMRRSPGKTTGYVLVPLYVELTAGETVEAAVNRAQFDEVWDVLQTMQEQDDVLAAFICRLAQAKGQTGKFDAAVAETVEVIGERVSLGSLLESVKTHLFEGLFSSWDIHFGELSAYYRLHGNCRLPDLYNKSLSVWMSYQRSLRAENKLSLQRVAQLDSVGFEWDDIKEKIWKKMFEELKAFKEKHGHCLVPSSTSYRKNKSRLGSWVIQQRMGRKEGEMSDERCKLLESLGFIWDKREHDWDRMFEMLKEYNNEFEHCVVPFNYKRNKELGNWVATTRRKYVTHQLSETRIKRLDSIGFVWDPLETVWLEMYKRLVAYKTQHGDCAVSKYHPDKQLSHWVRSQRRAYLKKIIQPDHLAKLEALDFPWSVLDADWQEYFSKLVAFKVEHGHFRVFKKNDKKLATWVMTQRNFYANGRMSKERIAKLEAIGFEWSPMATDWEKRISELEAFQEKHGHCQVPQKSGLCSWSKLQRKLHQKNRLSAERIARLEALGFEWKLP